LCSICAGARGNCKNADVPLSLMFSHDFWGHTLRPPNDDSDLNGNRIWWSHLSYRPLTVASFRLNFLMNNGRGLHDAGPFHATNILLQAVACMALVPFLTALTGRRRPDSSELEPTTITVAAGLLFASHPLHVESVANVTHRAEVLCVILLMLGWSAYARARALLTQPAPTCGTAEAVAVAAWLLLAAALHVLALLAKETAIVFPALMVVADVVLTAHQRASLHKRRGGQRATARRAWVSPVQDALDVFGNARGASSSSASASRWPLARWSLCIRAAGLLVWAATVFYTRIVLLTGGYSLDMQSMHNPISLLEDRLSKTLSVALVQAYAVSLLVWPAHLSHEHNAMRPVESLSDPRNLLTVLVWVVIGALVAWAAYSGNVWQAARSRAGKTHAGKTQPRGLKAGAKQGIAPGQQLFDEHADPGAGVCSFQAQVLPPTTSNEASPSPRLTVRVEPAHPISRRWRILAGLGVAAAAYLPASHLLVRVGFVLAERQMYLSTIGGSVVIAEVLCFAAELFAAAVLVAAGHGSAESKRGWSHVSSLLTPLATGVFPVVGMEVQLQLCDTADEREGLEASSQAGTVSASAAPKEDVRTGGGEAFEAKDSDFESLRHGHVAQTPHGPGAVEAPAPPKAARGEEGGGLPAELLRRKFAPVVTSPPRGRGSATEALVRDAATSTVELEESIGLELPDPAPSPAGRVRFAPRGRVVGASPAHTASPARTERARPAPAAGRSASQLAPVRDGVSRPACQAVPVPVIVPGCRPRLGSPGACLLWVMVVAGTAGFSLRAMLRAPVWLNDSTLSLSLLQQYPHNNPMGRYGLGTARLNAFEFNAALPQLVESSRLSNFVEPRMAVSQFLMEDVLPALRARDRGFRLSESSTLEEMHDATNMQELVGGVGVFVLGVSGSAWQLPDYAAESALGSPDEGPDVLQVDYACPNCTVVTSGSRMAAAKSGCAHALSCGRDTVQMRIASIISAARDQLNITTLEHALQAINAIQGFTWIIDAHRREMFQNLALVRGLGGLVVAAENDPQGANFGLPMDYPIPERLLLSAASPGMEAIVSGAVRAPSARLFRDRPFPPDRDPTAGPQSFLLPEDTASPHWAADRMLNRTEYLWLVAEVGSVLPPDHPKRAVIRRNAGIGRLLSHPRRWGHLHLGLGLLQRAAVTGRGKHKRYALSSLACFWAAMGRKEETLSALRRFEALRKTPYDDTESWEVPRLSAQRAERFVTASNFDTIAAPWAAEQITTDPNLPGPKASAGPHLAYRAEAIGCRFLISTVAP
jgi:hypothetical protein